MLQFIKQQITLIAHIFYPNVCPNCLGLLTKTEKVLCLSCEVNLPKTNFHFYNDNPVEKIFWGRAPIIHGTAFIVFEKGSKSRNLLQLIKYRNRPDLARHLGMLFGRTLSQQAPHFQEINCIVPVPLHPKKFKKRGYNQCDPIAESLGKALNKEVLPNAIRRKHDNATQTGKNRMNRWENVSEIFEIAEANKLKRKHVLLIDDVVTTGATLEACIQKILEIEGTAVSVATLAITL